jgi:hypothetical protein
MDAPTDPAKLRAVLERLEAEEARRLAEKAEAGEIVSVVLSVVVGKSSQIAAAVEQAKTDKLKELRAAGETREIVLGVNTVITGVCRPGEDTGTPVWKPMSPPYLTGPSSVAPDPDEEAVREEPQPPIIATYITVQTRRCHDDDDPGEVTEGWYSVDGKVVTVTDARGKYVGSRAMIGGEDPKALARPLLREKQPESFNGPISYPKLGWS